MNRGADLISSSKSMGMKASRYTVKGMSAEVSEYAFSSEAGDTVNNCITVMCCRTHGALFINCNYKLLICCTCNVANQMKLDL